MPHNYLKEIQTQTFPNNKFNGNEPLLLESNFNMTAKFKKNEGKQE